jgi:CRISPR/Cas system-associated exonuclease Cas4 (RecB family)
VTVREVIIGLAVAAVLGAVAIYLMLRWYRQRTGFAAGGTAVGRIVASDTGVEPAALLRDPGLGLCGRPDYLIQFEAAGRVLFVPVELKPGRRSRRVFESDALQLAAYLIALRGTVKDAASSFGYLRYAKTTFKVGLTRELENRVYEIVQAIRNDRGATTVHRSHAIVQRCVGCAVREHCDEALG